MISSIEISRPHAGHDKIQDQIDEERRFIFKIRIFRASIFFLILLWCAGFSILSLLPENKTLLVFYPVLKKIYSGVCHQDHKKTIFIGRYFLVCSRCSGIYLGALLSAFILMFVSVNKKTIYIKSGIISAAPMLCDVIFYNAGFYKYSIPAAFFTGAIFGSAVIILILSLIENNFFYNSKGLN